MADAPAVVDKPAATLALIYFDAGGGHRAAALALQEAVQIQARPWRVELINLQHILRPLDPLDRYFGLPVQDVYNSMLRRGWTILSIPLLRTLHASIRLTHVRQRELLERYWASRSPAPDLVVSLVPNFNRAIHQSVRRALPDVPSVTVLTDLADYPPHFWIERDTPAVICGSPQALLQAAAIGVPPGGRFGVSGMILRPALYAATAGVKNEAERGEARRALGLQPDRVTALLLYGGFGSRRMAAIVRRLERMPLPLQIIAVCGRNRRLQRRLERRARRSRLPMRIEGFSQAIPQLMACSDFMIGKPGPGSLSEAVQSRLPVIVECNAHTLPQERFNARWIEAEGFGLSIPSLRHLEAAVTQMFDPEERRRFRARAAAAANRAVWEIPDIFARLLRSRPTARG